MYYILNETNKIIAADDSLLELCGVTHIDELSTKIAKEDTGFDTLSDEHLSITLNDNKEIYTISKTILSSMLGHLTLVQVILDTEKVDSVISSDDVTDSTIDLSDDDLDSVSMPEIIKEEVPESEETNYNDLLLNDTSISINTDEESILEAKEDENTAFEEPLSLDTDTTSITEDTEGKDSSEINSIDLFNDSELFSIDLDESEEKNIVENTIGLDLKDDNLQFNTEKVVDTEEIVIDVESISNKIGISTDDYNTFLNEFIDTALNQEKDLQSSDNKKRTDAIYTLSHLSEILHLPVIGKSLTNINISDDDTRRKVVESFYTTLAQITTEPSKNNIFIENIDKKDESLQILDNTLEIDNEIKDTDVLNLEINDEQNTDEIEITDEPTIQEEPIVIEKEINSNSFGTISLEGITPKHFDFQLEEAANDLSLPVELIEEFVHDFIDQAHIETKKMLEAYEEGDLDAIQKIGHLLKGASSNLRINPLADTLYQIQFCEEPSKLEHYIKDYWAHFLSFENQINVISN